MNQDCRFDPLREFLINLIQDGGIQTDFKEDQSLILSRVLDSLAVMKLILFLEEKYEINLDSYVYDVSDLDSFLKIEKFLKEKQSSK